MAMGESLGAQGRGTLGCRELDSEASDLSKELGPRLLFLVILKTRMSPKWRSTLTRK